MDPMVGRIGNASNAGRPLVSSTHLPQEQDPSSGAYSALKLILLS